jgi:hypothetical protein
MKVVYQIPQDIAQDQSTIDQFNLCAAILLFKNDEILSFKS